MLKKCYRNALKKKCIKNTEKCRKWISNRDPFWDHFWPSGRPLLSQACLWSQNDSQGSPKSPRNRFLLHLVRFCSFHAGYFSLICLRFFVSLNPDLQNPGHKFKLFGVTSRIISALRSALHGTVAGRPYYTHS